jgi:signal transduction histidine kinase
MRLLYHRLKQLPPDMITLELAHDLPAIKGNPAELEQVILNLVLNALDAVDGIEGKIVLRTHSKDGDWVILEVTDNGLGIDAENMNKLFEPFFTTKPQGQGIGIGLSTCYHILQAHGGKITVDSAPGEGAVFTAILPQYRQ